MRQGVRFYRLGVQHEPLLQVLRENTGPWGTFGIWQNRDGKTLSFPSMKPMSKADPIAAKIKSTATVVEQVIAREKSAAAVASHRHRQRRLRWLQRWSRQQTCA
ncbi:unnamed protein product [Linum tenue]|uniref:Uncharacterized protein n=1 Tax=Linum tenue TaxID=586396 RepID=A0AAV0H119_9ROSI|nr:unnamed protein product [Linum tenue]